MGVAVSEAAVVGDFVLNCLLCLNGFYISCSVPHIN